MSITKARILEAIFKAIEDTNRFATPSARLAQIPTAILSGEGAMLDSLALITLIVSVEEHLMSNLGVSISVLDEEVWADPNGPYRSVDALADWILKRLV